MAIFPPTFEFKGLDLVLQEEWKYKLTPRGSRFAAGALDLLGVISDVVEAHRLNLSVTTDLAHTYFAEDFRAIVAHLTWQSNDAKANRAEAVLD